MFESYIKLANEYIFLRHNSISPNRKTLLFVHGLGESGLCFQEVFEFEDEKFNNFNLLVPDMVGYGRSSVATDYNFNIQVNRLWKMIEQIEIKEKVEINELIVIGHSLGGDLTTLFCDSDQENIVKKYINIEGDITQFDLFISSKAVNAYNRGGFPEFKQWLRDFSNKIWENENDESMKRYFASFCFCRAEAFLANSQELVKRNTIFSTEKFQSEIGKIYASLTLPKIFCYGTKSLSPKTLDFLNTMNLESKAFKDAGHSVMIDKKNEFYSFLYDFVSV